MCKHSRIENQGLDVVSCLERKSSCIVSGHDTKAMMNNSGPRYKRSKVERDLNLDVMSCVIILLILCFLGGIGKYTNCSF